MKILSVSVGEASYSSLKEQPKPAEAGEALWRSKRQVLRTRAETTQAARTTLRLMREADIHPKQRAQLCDGFSRIDTLPKKECARRTRLMRERIYARTETAHTTLRLMSKRIYTQAARQETGGTGYLSAIRSFFPAPAIRSL